MQHPSELQPQSCQAFAIICGSLPDLLQLLIRGAAQRASVQPLPPDEEEAGAAMHKAAFQPAEQPVRPTLVIVPRRHAEYWRRRPVTIPSRNCLPPGNCPLPPHRAEMAACLDPATQLVNTLGASFGASRVNVYCSDTYVAMEASLHNNVLT